MKCNCIHSIGYSPNCEVHSTPRPTKEELPCYCSGMAHPTCPLHQGGKIIGRTKEKLCVSKGCKFEVLNNSEHCAMHEPFNTPTPTEEETYKFRCQRCGMRVFYEKENKVCDPCENENAPMPPRLYHRLEETEGGEKMKQKCRWSLRQLSNHIRKNTTEKAGAYSAVVVVAALYKKLYGEFPKIGLSGAQAEFADSILPYLPKRIINDPYEC